MIFHQTIKTYLFLFLIPLFCHQQKFSCQISWTLDWVVLLYIFLVLFCIQKNEEYIILKLLKYLPRLFVLIHGNFENRKETNDCIQPFFFISSTAFTTKKKLFSSSFCFNDFFTTKSLLLYITSNPLSIFGFTSLIFSSSKSNLVSFSYSSKSIYLLKILISSLSLLSSKSKLF